MRIDIVTLFPDLFTSPLQVSILKRAQEAGLVQVLVHDLRAFATDKHRTADDRPYGGGAGMVLKPELLFAAVENLPELPGRRIILTTPQGRPFTQQKAVELSREAQLVILCGHYEGVDERVREHLVTDEISVGDYVLTGGEIPALVIVDAVVRLIPGVLGNEESSRSDSYSSGIFDYPHYTRPEEFRGWRVPEVLQSGHHEQIARWRREQALRRTWERRPDLIERVWDDLSPHEQAMIRGWQEASDVGRRTSGENPSPSEGE